MLYDICGMPSWDSVSEGLWRMWEGEVLGKFPVAQHILFCKGIFPATWLDDAAPAPAATSPSTPQGPT